MINSVLVSNLNRRGNSLVLPHKFAAGKESLSTTALGSQRAVFCIPLFGFVLRIKCSDLNVDTTQTFTAWMAVHGGFFLSVTLLLVLLHHTFNRFLLWQYNQLPVGFNSEMNV